MQWRLIFILALMVLVVVFSLANAQPVAFGFFTYTTKVSLALIIIISALIGAIAGVLASLSSQLQMRRQLADKETEIRELKRARFNTEGESVAGERGRPNRPHIDPT